MELENILNKNVSYQDNAWTPLSKELTIKQVLDSIKSGNYVRQISKLRNLLKQGELEKYSIHKKNLPAVTFCGIFNEKRRKNFIKKYNNLIVIDIDKLDKEELNRTKSILNDENFIFSYWESPSQKGIKGLVAIKYNIKTEEYDFDSRHKSAFKQLVDYFKSKYNISLDESGSDITRLCFLSSDSNLVLKKIFQLFEIDKIEIAQSQNTKDKVPLRNQNLKPVSRKDLLLNPKGKNDPSNRNRIQSIIKYLSKRNLSITNSYEQWYRVAYAIADTFTHDIGEKYYLRLCQLDGSKYNEVASKNMLVYCYENSMGAIKFETIIHFAKNQRYIIKKTVGG